MLTGTDNDVTMNNKIWFNSVYARLLTGILRIISLLLGGKLNASLEQPIEQYQRIIEIGADRVRFVGSCLDRDTSNYLGLLTQNLDRTTFANPFITEVDKSWGIKKNNADILIVSEPQHLQRMWFFNEYKHVQYLLYAPSDLFALISGLVGLIKNVVFRRIDVVGVMSLTDDLEIERPILVVKNLKRIRPNARRYISPVLGVASFFASLNSQDISYAILRWFEDLPAIEPGEDIDMLVADADIEKVEALIQKHPGIIPCDIYTTTGLPGTAYKNMAYYPPQLAEQILARSTKIKDTFLVPDPKIHFYSLAYHAIYHKGQKSGIPPSVAEEVTKEKNPEHEYSQILEDLAKSLDFEVEITLKDLDRFLASIDWRPSEDTLARLDSSEIWLDSSKDRSSSLPDISEIAGLAVFFVRQKALELNLGSTISDLLIKEGFNIIDTTILDPEAARRVKYQVRGGNWGRGPWSESGGDPAMVIVAVDLMPQKPTQKELAKQPHLSNSRITVKDKIRDAVNQTLAKEKQCNTVHSSDNEREAWNYLEIAVPDKCEAIKQKIVGLNRNFQTDYRVTKVLTRFGRRAKIEVVEYQDRLAVKKTFRPGCEKFFQREAFVSKTYSDCLKTIPQVIASGSNYLIYPYYNDVLQFSNRQSKLLPLSVAKEALETLKFFYQEGYALIDFQPANLICDRHSGLKVIDFEFLYQYPNKPESFERCYELAGIPDDFAGDKPDFKIEMSYDSRWKPYVGLSLHSLLYDPIWLQYPKRWTFALTRLPVRFMRNKLKAIADKRKLNLKSLLR